MATVLEHSKVSPARDTTPELSLPFVFFDLIWYGFTADPIVFFFDLPSCSKSHFLDTIVPHLKTSLSFTLAHFSPYAGNIIHPLTSPDTNKPVLRYESGDSVSFTVSESSADFNQLTGNHPRPCEEFYAFAPCLPPATCTGSSIRCPVLAVQVTLFPGQGISIGFVTHHAVADASTVACFIQAWALITKELPYDDDGGGGGDKMVARLAEANCLPFYDRESVTNINGLDSVYWDKILKSSRSVEPPPLKIPVNNFRATFVLKRDQIEKLKDRGGGVSSFTVICALVWVCSAKSEAADDEDEPEYFCFAADCRGRLRPPLPANYFGNCVALVKAELKHGQVNKGRDRGFVMAVKAIGEAINDAVLSERGILYGAESWPEEFGKLVGKRQYGVAGSPRFDFYDKVDFGWGRPKKYEPLFIDGGRSMWLSTSKDCNGDLEIGMSRPMVEMDAFAAVFREVLADLIC